MERTAWIEILGRITCNKEMSEELVSEIKMKMRIHKNEDCERHIYIHSARNNTKEPTILKSTEWSERKLRDK